MMKKNIISLLCFLMVLTALMPCGFIPQASAAELNDIYVSVDGSDSASGTIEAPLRTLERAKTLAAERVSTATKDINIIVRGGTYNVGEGLKFNASTSGKENAKINFKAYEGEKVYVTNSITIPGEKFSLVTDEQILGRIPSYARGNIYSVNLQSVGIKEYGEIRQVGQSHTSKPGSRALIVDSNQYQIARWPNAGYATIENIFTVTKGMKFSYSANKGDQWATAEEPWIHGFWYYMWSDESMPVTEIDCYNKTISTQHKHPYNIRKGKKFYIFNLIEELDIPGEWYLDSKTGMLYVYPKSDLTKSNIQFAPYTTEIVYTNGAKNITFSGITFENTCGNAIKLDYSDNIVFDNCEIRNAGQQAMRINETKNSGIRNSYIHDTGNGGIWVDGGDFINFTPNNNFIENCHIERYSNGSRAYAAGVHLRGVGDRLAHCRINNSEHMAVGFGGVDNIFEYNEIYNVLKYSDDMGAFYSGRSWILGGNHIRYNYVHDNAGDRAEGVLPFTQGIYFDDGLSGTSVYGNVFENMYNGVFGNFSRYQTIENNVFLNCDKGILYAISGDVKTLDQRHENIAKAYEEGGMDAVQAVGSLNAGHFTQLELAMSRNWDNYLKKFTWLNNVFRDNPLSPNGNTIRNNAISARVGVEMHEYVRPDNVIENNYHTTEIKSIEDIPELTQNVKGFIPIEIDKIGIEGEEKKQVGEFRTLGPVNNQTETPSELVALVWEPSSGANKYLVTVAEDENFEKIVLREEVISNYRMLRKLKGNGQKYYWKVEASTTSMAYDKTPVLNSNGVQCFRTKVKEDINKTRLNTIIKQSWVDYNSAAEEKDGGSYVDGSKEPFKLRITKAEEISQGARTMYSPYLSVQKTVDATTIDLETYQKHFNNSRVPETIDISSLLVPKEWSDPNIISGGVLRHYSKGSVGYSAKHLETYKIIKFKGIFVMDEASGGWSSVGLRAIGTSGAPWSGPSYIFLVKPDVIELQKFGAQTTEGKLFLTVPNDYIKDGVEHLIEFGAFNEGDGVRIKLIVDGKEVYNVLDQVEPIIDSGYLQLYNVGSATITMSSAE